MTFIVALVGQNKKPTHPDPGIIQGFFISNR